jgi:ribosomal protein S18 acetylase RimI-like enzyme
LLIRLMEKNDRNRLVEVVTSAGNFNGDEMDVAMELIDEFLEDPQGSGYVIQVLQEEEDLHGYVCYGPVPLTETTYDLYWIAVRSDSQGKGYGQALIRAAEDDVQKRGGRLLLIETSSVDSYQPTIRFYKHAGYELIGRIADFYRAGDDKLTFAKRL